MASPATALASNVLPVPGGPTSNTPLGILAPMLANFFGFFKKSTNSFNSSFSSSAPATSVNLVLLSFSNFAREFPKSKALALAPPPPPILLITKNITPINKIYGSKPNKVSTNIFSLFASKTSTVIPLSSIN